MTTSNSDESKSRILSTSLEQNFDFSEFESASPLEVDTLAKMANAFMKELNTGTVLDEVKAPLAKALNVASKNAINPHFAELDSDFIGASAIQQTQIAQPFGFLNDIRPLFESAESVAKNLERELENLLQLPGSFTEVQNDLEREARAATDAFEISHHSQDLLNFYPKLEPLGVSNPFPVDLGLQSSQYDVGAIRRDFPILQEKVFGHDLIWFDNAATTQKPRVVIDRLSHFYTHENSNIHRSAHYLAAKSSDAYEAARESVRSFLNARTTNEIVFARGATEAINLVAQSWGRKNLKQDDEVVVSHLEHHANIVPWQMVCAETGAKLRVIPVDDNGDLLLSELDRILGPKTKFVSFAQVSNALGTVTPVEEIVNAAHRYGAKVLVDGAQSVSHMQVDVQEYDCDFFVFSGHKIYAPTGIGVLYGKEELLNEMSPWQGGGNMIHDVTFEKTIYQQAPVRFEAGTGNIADAVGLASALEYLNRLGMRNISAHEEELMSHAENELRRVPKLKILGNPNKRAGVLPFVIDGVSTQDVSQFLNQFGIAVRAGHHCAQPILRRFGVESTVRPSFGIYNTCDEVDVLAESLMRLVNGRRR